MSPDSRSRTTFRAVWSGRSLALLIVACLALEVFLPAWPGVAAEVPDLVMLSNPYALTGSMMILSSGRAKITVHNPNDFWTAFETTPYGPQSSLDSPGYVFQNFGLVPPNGDASWIWTYDPLKPESVVINANIVGGSYRAFVVNIIEVVLTGYGGLEFKDVFGEVQDAIGEIQSSLETVHEFVLAAQAFDNKDSKGCSEHLSLAAWTIGDIIKDKVLKILVKKGVNTV